MEMGNSCARNLPVEKLTATLVILPMNSIRNKKLPKLACTRQAGLSPAEQGATHCNRPSTLV